MNVLHKYYRLHATYLYGYGALSRQDLENLYRIFDDEFLKISDRSGYEYLCNMKMATLHLDKIAGLDKSINRVLPICYFCNMVKGCRGCILDIYCERMISIFGIQLKIEEYLTGRIKLINRCIEEYEGVTHETSIKQ